jgi:hypothetical protein
MSNVAVAGLQYKHGFYVPLARKILLMYVAILGPVLDKFLSFQ